MKSKRIAVGAFLGACFANLVLTASIAALAQNSSTATTGSNQHQHSHQHMHQGHKGGAASGAQPQGQ
jgi:Ca2+/Na+ antiporter